MDEAEAMHTEVADQGHCGTAFGLGYLLQTVRKDFDGAEVAYRAAVGGSGCAGAH